MTPSASPQVLPASSPIPRTPLIERVLTLSAFVISAFALMVSLIQTRLMERQTAISDRQTQISDRQLLLSTRPHVSTKIVASTNDLSAERLIIQNQGIFAVRNLRLTHIYLAKVTGKGWYVSVPSGGGNRETLPPNGAWEFNLAGYGKTFSQPPMNPSFTVEGNQEFVVFLLSFEREIDGHGYVHLEPMMAREGKLFAFGESLSGPTENISGPLSNVSHPAIELAFEYFRRRPFPGNYEIYNYQYLLGYQQTGSLGPISWLK